MAGSVKMVFGILRMRRKKLRTVFSGELVLTVVAICPSREKLTFPNYRP
jgi:hypothetical protein